MTLDTDIAKAVETEPPANFELPRALRVMLLAKDPPAGWLDAIAASGHVMTLQATTSNHALELAAQGVADVAIMTVPFDADDIGFCQRLQAASALPVLLVGDHLNEELLDRALDLGICGVLPKSAAGTSLAVAMTLGARWFGLRNQLRAYGQQLAAQNRQLNETLQNRKLIERAKGVYMRVLGLQEAEAHRRLQQESQKRRLGLAELARKIIESDELLGR